MFAFLCNKSDLCRGPFPLCATLQAIFALYIIAGSCKDVLFFSAKMFVAPKQSKLTVNEYVVRYQLMSPGR